MVKIIIKDFRRKPTQIEERRYKQSNTVIKEDKNNKKRHKKPE